MPTPEQTTTPTIPATGLIENVQRVGARGQVGTHVAPSVPVAGSGRELEVIRRTIKKMRNDYGDRVDDLWAESVAQKIVRNLRMLANAR